MPARSPRRIWTAVVTVQGFASMAATWSDRDEHDSQHMQAAHDALTSCPKFSGAMVYQAAVSIL
jgi:hypothetical protein